jgi:hypothetical protein
MSNQSGSMTFAHLSSSTALGLQRTAGNRAVVQLVERVVLASRTRAQGWSQLGAVAAGVSRRHRGAISSWTSDDFDQRFSDAATLANGDASDRSPPRRLSRDVVGVSSAAIGRVRRHCRGSSTRNSALQAWLDVLLDPARR